MSMEADSVRSAAMRRTRVQGWVVLAALGLALVPACGDDGDDVAGTDPTVGRSSTTEATTPPTRPPGSTPSGTDPAAGEEAAVRAAVDCYWQTIVEANDPPDPDHPGFARCFTGPALERSRQRVVEHQAAGEYVKDSTGVERYGTSVTVHSDGSAQVIECFIDDAVVLGPTGSVVDDTVASYDVEFRVVRLNGYWYVDDTISWATRSGRSCGE